MIFMLENKCLKVAKYLEITQRNARPYQSKNCLKYEYKYLNYVIRSNKYTNDLVQTLKL